MTNLPSTPLPEQGDFSERLTEILTKLDLGEYLGEGGVDAARTAIRILVLEEIIGTDEQVIEGSYSGTTEFVSTEISKPIRNYLRAEQRKKLEDNHDTK